MQALNGQLATFLKESKLQLHCRRRTVKLIGADSPKSFSSGGWSKAQDSVIIMEFIPWVMERLPLDLQDDPWRFIHVGSRAVTRSMRILYSEPLFMNRESAARAAEEGYVFLSAYARLVEFGITVSSRLVFNLVPKLHYYHHVVNDLLTISTSGDPLQLPLNPLCFATPQDEDFISRVARITRKVKSEHTHSRVLRRYKAALAEKMGFLQ